VVDDGATVIETQISWVVLKGDRAYKRKKPVRTSFLDLTDPAIRRWACEEEVRLNRRLNPDVYLGVEEIPGPDWVVVMRRMPENRRLSRLVGEGEDVGNGVRDIARRLAALHLGSGRAPSLDAAASAVALLGRWEANHAELAPLSGQLRDPSASERAVALARRYVAGREALFAERVSAGRAVDGHGDLLANDIFLLNDGPRILDTIDFAPGLRAVDGLADVASLAMDLERLGDRVDADRLLAWYQDFTGDQWPASLAHFHIAYRAQLRARVACVRAAQASHQAAEADDLLRLALDHLEAGRVTLTLVGGPPATGKSSLARALSAGHDWVVVHSDEVRQELAALSARIPAGALLMAGVYSPAMTSLTYGEMLHRAADLLGHGESVILDASWGDPMWRLQARQVADRVAADLIELRCDAPVTVAAERVRRLAAVDSYTAADMATALAERFVAWPEAVTVDTSTSLDAAVVAAEAAIRRAVAAQ
jgi:aminoglycoside phosphotransferase family enzyme/predicted kinase